MKVGEDADIPFDVVAPTPDVTPAAAPTTTTTAAPIAAEVVTPAPTEVIAPEAIPAPADVEIAAAPVEEAPVSVAPTPTEVVTPEAAPVAEKPTEIKAAEDLIEAVDKGGIPLSPGKVNKIAEDLGLEVSTKAKPEDTVQRIRKAVKRVAKPAETVAPEPVVEAAPEPVVEPTPTKALTQSGMQPAAKPGVAPTMGERKIAYAPGSYHDLLNKINTARKDLTNAAGLKDVNAKAESLDNLESDLKERGLPSASRSHKVVRENVANKLAAHEQGVAQERQVHAEKQAALKVAEEKYQREKEPKAKEKADLRMAAEKRGATPVGEKTEGEAAEHKTLLDAVKSRNLNSVIERLGIAVRDRPIKLKEALGGTRTPKVGMFGFQKKAGLSSKEIVNEVHKAAKELEDEEAFGDISLPSNKGKYRSKIESKQEAELEAEQEEEKKTKEPEFDFDAALHAHLADVLAGINFSESTVQLDTDADANADVYARMREENKIAEYDPKTDTFYFTEAGLSQETVLHEMVHAATVKTLRDYETNPASLDPEQREAAEHLNRLYEKTKPRLKNKYPDAFENVYEFVSYAMTNRAFQSELVRLRMPSQAKYTKAERIAKGIDTVWNQFVEALANLFGLTDMVSETRDKTNKLEELRILKEGNLLLETAAAFAEIVAPPQKGVDVAPLAQRVQAGAAPSSTDKLYKDAASRIGKTRNDKFTLNQWRKYTFSNQGLQHYIKKFQNQLREGEIWANQQRMSHRLNDAAPSKGGNNYIGEQQMAAGETDNYRKLGQKFRDKLQSSTLKYAKATGMKVDEAMARLGVYMTATTLNERREEFFVENVPLSTAKTLPGGYSAADVRNQIFQLLAERRIRDMFASPEEAYKFLKEMVIDNKYGEVKDKMGYSQRDYAIMKKGMTVKPSERSIDFKSNDYDILKGYTYDHVQNILKDKANDSQQNLIKDVEESVRGLEERITENNREANYWTKTTDDYVAFYGWKNYYSLRGNTDYFIDKETAEQELSGPRRGGGVYGGDLVSRSTGRETAPDNIIQSAMAEHERSAMRAGYKDVTPALANALKAGMVSGQKNTPVASISAADRAKNGVDYNLGLDPNSEFKGRNRFFEFKKDGSIDIWEVNSDSVINMLRPPFKESSPVLKALNTFTSAMGQFHTRYMPKFAPFDFVRNTIFNGMTISAEMGPAAGWRYASAIASKVTQNGFYKSMLVSKMYADGKLEELRKMAVDKKDPFITDLMEYLERGARVSIVRSFSTRSQFEHMMRDFEQGNLSKAKEALDKYADVWLDTFEFVSRSAAYSVAKENEFNKLKKQRDKGDKNLAGKTDEELLDRARETGARFAKNLANFELAGEWGRSMGSMFMFFRASATGAVRAIDALTPAFESTEAAMKRLPEDITSNPEALANFKEEHKKAKKNAQLTLKLMTAFGVTMYTMATLAGGDDDDGNSLVGKDDMALWTRGMRLPLGFLGLSTDNPLVIPWGFGPGAFAAAGAQVAATVSGHQSIGDMLGNTVTVGLDSFLPLPVARFNPLDHPGFWLLDSMLPSAVRPFFEYTANIDGLGRDIYRDRYNKYGAAYSGGENIPEMYKDFSKFIYEATDGDHSISPNTLRFALNSSIDSIATVSADLNNTALFLMGQKDFDPKTDLFFLNSFIGSKASLDARQYSQVEDKIVKLRDGLKAAENQPQVYGNYISKHPNAFGVVDMYNSYLPQINEIRKQAASVNAMNLPPKDRKEYIKSLYLMRDMYMRRVIDMADVYGVSP